MVLLTSHFTLLATFCSLAILSLPNRTNAAAVPRFFTSVSRRASHQKPQKGESLVVPLPAAATANRSAQTRPDTPKDKKKAGKKSKSKEVKKPHHGHKSVRA